MKIVTIVGARPQFVKAAALCRTIKKRNQNGFNITEILVHTGQHYDYNMSDCFIDEMEIPKPDYHLGIGGLSHGAMTGRMLESIETVLLKEKPDWTLIYGDTNSTLAGAIASVKLHIPVAHVEAGLRSFNRKMPEEINRLVADQCADLLFTPSAHSTEQLKREGVAESKIVEVGDIMYEASLYYRQKSLQRSSVLSDLNLKKKGFALATVHRAENTDDLIRLEEIFGGLSDLSEHMPVVLPLHPRTKQVLEKHQMLSNFNSGLMLIEPVGYFDMIQLESNAAVILTDSGGVQKEAYFFEVPCITLRQETEWVELVEHGYNRLVRFDRKHIVENAFSALNNSYDWKTHIYGDGQTSDKIIDKLKG